ncbi:MAG: YihY/virulence factor BrkB family protein [Bacteroidetes bacterium]|nr:YihY/virulence factor BrkB family protein [Bacteroidota bacterium]
MIPIPKKISRFKQNFLKWRLVRSILVFSKKIIVPGFDGMPLYDVARFFIHGILQGSITSRASSIAFSFFLAIFPMIIVFFTLIPFIPIPHFQISLFHFINNVIPDQAEPLITSTMTDIIHRPRGQLLSVTFLLTIIFATNGFDSIIDAFNNTVHTIETRSWIKQKLISILLFFLISIILIISIVLLTSGTIFLEYLVEKHILTSLITVYLLEAGKWVVLLAMFFFTISFIYYLAPARSSKFRFISAGSSLATVLTAIATVGFNFYVSNFSSYNALYGSIGTLLIVLIWIYFNAIILLIGFELNASIREAGLDKS